MSNAELIEKYVIGKIKFVGNDDFHLYEFPSGKRQASVTTKNVLEKPFLYDYSAKVAFEYLEKEGFSKINYSNRSNYLAGAQQARRDILNHSSDNIGTPAHNAIEKYLLEWIATKTLPSDITHFVTKKYLFDNTLNKEIDVTDPRVYASVRSAEKWLRKMEHKIKPLFSEIRVGDERYSAGTVDFVFEFIETGELYILDWKTSNYMSDDYALQASAYAKFLEHMIGVKVGAFVAHLSKDKDEYEIYEVKNINKNYSAFKHMSKVYDWIQSSFDKLKKDITIYDTTGKKHTKSIRKC
jgi:hypothetical protein